jgi:hypothetical protein
VSGKAITPLRVDDEDFLVASTIERCPKTMMIRELVMNALEAAQNSERKTVEIGITEFLSAPKLTIWNTGPGLDDAELLKICNIAASLRKEKSLSANFGMGAKVASLPSNQIGMRYRSCKSGKVHQLLLGKRDGKYGIIPIQLADTGEYETVIDVTDNEARPKDFDWTEVLLCGNREDQDTVRDPYNGDPKLKSQWLADTLYHRFYRLPDGVKVTLLKGTNKLDGNRQFETIPQRLRYFAKHETILQSSGIKVHFLYDEPYNDTSHNRSVSGAITTDLSTVAVIYRNEMYDVKSGRNWTLDAPIFGIPFGAKHISIHIELPDDFPVTPEQYRQFLRHNGGEQPQVTAKDFAEIVRESRPEWLLELIQSFAPKGASSDDIREDLQRLLNQLRVKRVSPRVVADGPINVDLGTGSASADDYGASEGESGKKPKQRPTDLSIAPSGAKRAGIFSNLERAPKIILLETDEQVDEKNLKGRAALYYLETGELFVNMKYAAIEEMRQMLEDEYAGTADPEILRGMTFEKSRRAMIMRVGRTVVFALAKQLNKEWDQKAQETAWSPESLSMAADNIEDSLQTVKRQLGAALRPNRSEAASV